MWFLQGGYEHAHFTDEESETQKGWMTCPRSQSQSVRTQLSSRSAGAPKPLIFPGLHVASRMWGVREVTPVRVGLRGDGEPVLGTQLPQAGGVWASR